MIGTVFASLLSSVLFGLVFAAAAQIQIRTATAQRGTGRVLAVVLLFEAMVVWPVGLYFYLVHRDWSWMYLVDPRRLPFGTGAAVFAGYTGTLLGGYGAGYALVRTSRLRLLYAAVALLVLAHILFLALFSERLLVASTFAGYPTHAVSIMRVRLGYVLPASVAGVLASFLFAAWQLWDQGRKQIL